jgi:hypothetical protein
LFLLLAGAGLASAERRPSLIDEFRILPSEHAAIDYWNAQPSDPVAHLQTRIDSGKQRLAHDPQFGYLPAVLEALDVPVASQVLVFSKTSFQAARIFPRVPRAIYHNDTISVGFVRGSDVMELASLDAKLGVVFYTLSQVETSQPRFEARTTECLSCHAGPATVGVPGLFIRSVKPDRSGTPERAPGFLTDHRSPLEERWGGWYVSGEHGSMKHLGNAIYSREGEESSLVGAERLNVSKLDPYISPVDYLARTSDIVSLMLLEHQTRMTNLLVRLNYETRMAAKTDPLPEAVTRAAEELLRYMLFTDEAPLAAPVRGSSEFVRRFEARGKKDRKGRSLHELDLDKRLLRYPCSYMVESEAYRALPAPATAYLRRRLGEILSGKDRSPEFAAVAPGDRRAIREILEESGIL